MGQFELASTKRRQPGQVQRGLGGDARPEIAGGRGGEDDRGKCHQPDALVVVLFIAAKVLSSARHRSRAVRQLLVEVLHREVRIIVAKQPSIRSSSSSGARLGDRRPMRRSISPSSPSASKRSAQRWNVRTLIPRSSDAAACVSYFASVRSSKSENRIRRTPS
jgi:hypothetical protein